jgi:hypothetical protein
MTVLEERAPIVAVDAPAPAPSRSRSEPLRAVLLALPFVVLAELLLMRMFYRVGIFIPKQGSFRTVYTVLSDFGSFAFNLASVLALAALGLLTLLAFRHGDRTLAFVIAAFLVSILAAPVAGVEAVGPVPRLAFLLALLAVTVPFLRSGAEVAHRLLVAAIAACFVLSTYSGLAQGAGVGGAPGISGGQLAAELVVVLAAAIAPMAWLRTDGFRLRPPVVAAPLAASFVAAWTANGAVTGILVLWTVGLRLYLAPWIYAIALWAFFTVAIGWLPRWPWRSAGLVLLIAGGMLLGSTYQQSLGILAVVLLTDGVAFGGLPARGACRTSRAQSRASGFEEGVAPPSRGRRRAVR